MVCVKFSLNDSELTMVDKEWKHFYERKDVFLLLQLLFRHSMSNVVLILKMFESHYDVTIRSVMKTTECCISRYGK
jgi:hypothetical protein